MPTAFPATPAALGSTDLGEDLRLVRAEREGEIFRLFRLAALIAVLATAMTSFTATTWWMLRTWGDAPSLPAAPEDLP